MALEHYYQKKTIYREACRKLLACVFYSRNPYSFNWMKPRSYAYHSMADADWGWKKRRDDRYSFQALGAC